MSYLNTWAGWVIGGSILGTVVLVAAVIALNASGLSNVVSLVTDTLKPITVKLAGIFADALGLVWENLRDGLKYIAKSGKAVFALLMACAVVVVFVYFPTKHKTTARVTQQLHRDYRFVAKRKPSSVANWVPPIFGYKVK